MRVLYFSRSYTNHDRRFLVELASSSHEVWFQRLQDDPARYETRSVPQNVHELQSLGGGDPVTSPLDWIPLAPRLEAVLEHVKPDLVHAGPVQSCAFLTALVGFHPLLSMSWGSDLLVDARRDEFWAWMTRYALQRSDMLVTDCAEVSDAANRIAGVHRDRIVQFPWGVDIKSFRPGNDNLGVRRRSGWERSSIVISTRSFELNYGVLHLLEGFLRASAESPSLRLVLLGDGSQRPDIERFVQENGLLDVVWIAGAVQAMELPEYFRSADIYASCALSDGSSLSLLEAMATGLPALVTDRASNREWISGPDQGLLAPFGDVSAIAAGLIRLAGLPTAHRLEIAARNRSVIEQRANWELNIAKLLEAYDLLDARRSNGTTADPGNGQRRQPEDTPEP